MYMADQIEVVPGYRPWQPAPDAELTAVLQRYSMPLCGILRQHDVFYVFWCFLGQADDSHLWAYVYITEGEAQELVESDRAQLPKTLHVFTSGRHCVVAYAMDDGGIVLSEAVPEMPFGDSGAITAAASLLANRLAQMADELSAASKRVLEMGPVVSAA